MKKYFNIDLDVKDFINQYDYKTKDSDNYTVCCPYCLERYGKVDYKYKLGISVSKKIGHCFRCGAVLHFTQTFGKKLDINNEIDELKKMVFNIGQKKELKEDLVIENEIIDLKSISLVPTLEYTPLAYNYLKNRNVSDKEIFDLNIRVGIRGKWIGRILFPIYNKDTIVFLVGRSYNEDPYRYLNSKGNKKSLLYSIGEKTDTCILCEGIFSAIAAHRYTRVHSIATLGKGITQDQIKQIIKNYKIVYYSFDGDVKGWAKEKVIKPLMQNNIKVYDIKLPYEKDPDDLGEEYLQFFKNARRIF